MSECERLARLVEDLRMVGRKARDEYRDITKSTGQYKQEDFIIAYRKIFNGVDSLLNAIGEKDPEEKPTEDVPY